MQSAVTVRLSSSRGGGGGGVVGCSCCRSASAADLDELTTIEAPPPTDDDTTRRPRHNTAPHQPTNGASKATPVLLSLKRLLLLRPRASTGPTARSGSPNDEQADPPLAKEDPALATAEQIDMRQFKSVHIDALTASSSASGGLHQLSITFWPRHTYQLSVSSAAEARIWHDVFSAYADYKPYGGDQITADASTIGAATGAQAVPAAESSSYCAYGIPSLYARAIESCFSYLRTHGGYAREGLFRTGKSSSLLLRQILLNDGLLDGGPWQRDNAATTPLDLHVVAFIAKNLLRSLPETLLTNALMNKIFDATSRDDSSLLIRLLRSLPRVNFRLLQSLFEVLFLTASSPTSRMTVESLTKVVGPNLLPKDEPAWLRSMTTGTPTVRSGAAFVPISTLDGSSSPSASSIPMQRFFEVVFENGRALFPDSDVFNTPAATTATTTTATATAATPVPTPVPVVQSKQHDAALESKPDEKSASDEKRAETTKDDKHDVRIIVPINSPDTTTTTSAAVQPVDDSDLPALRIHRSSLRSSSNASRLSVDLTGRVVLRPRVSFASTDIIFPPPKVHVLDADQYLHTPSASPRSRTPDHFEREAECDPVAHDFPIFHYIDDE